MSEPFDDPARELYTLTAALRAHLEILKQAGTSGLPRAARAAAAPPEPALDAPRAVPAAVQRPPPEQARPAPAPASPAPAGESSRDPAERERALGVLSERVAACQNCGLHRTRTQTVFARGTSKSGLCFVGEGPGADEDAQGFPFVGKAGQLLDRMIAAMGFERDDVYVCNIVKCRPPDNRKPEPEEMQSCMPFLTEQLELVGPQVIVALGATAVQGLLGTTGGITRLRGRWRLYRGKIPVMPTFHPAYLLRNPQAKRDVWEDLQEVLRHMGLPVPGRS